MPKLVPALLAATLLLGFAPAGALAADWAKAQKITVVTVEYAFKPANLTFHAGIPYRLHLDNKGKEAHEFTASDFFKTLDMRNPEMTGPDHQEIVLQPGGNKDFYFVAKQAGSFDLRCSDHDWAGMVGHISVTP